MSPTTSSVLWATFSFIGLLLGVGEASPGGKFSFDVHHRFSDRLKGQFPTVYGHGQMSPLPEKGSLEYYTAMVHRDWASHPGRRLSSVSDDDRTPLAFANGNDTYRLDSLGFLLYANVSVGTPSLSFLVALDTGSDLFWLPCDCISCVRALRSSSGQTINLNIYSPKTSSTGAVVPCNSTSCDSKSKCTAPDAPCPYQVLYASNGTSSAGVLVEDVLHLITDDDQEKAVNAQITFGCGRIQTGSFLDGAAPNGLFGLGLTNTSVPSILAREGLTANSFSMCFGPDGLGRISFGDKGSSGQSETPINIGHSHPFYNVSITQISVGGPALDVEFTAIFDSGTSFTYLSDPAYTLITQGFNSGVKEKRRPQDPTNPFEYCYDLSPNQSRFEVPNVNLTMKGGDLLFVTDPVIIFSLNGSYMYCLGLLKGEDNMDVIGQNFMTGYNIVFDREKMMLGWTASDCYNSDDMSMLPISPSMAPTLVPYPESTPSPSPNSSPNPAAAFGPEETAGTGNTSQTTGAFPPASGHSWRPSPSIFAFMIILTTVLAMF